MVATMEIIFYPVKPLLQMVIATPLTILSYFKKRRQCPVADNPILLFPAQALVNKIIRKELSSRSIIEAYISRIKSVNTLINAVVEDRFELALNEADAVDNLIESGKYSPKELEEKFPLLGVPITVKESICVKGMSNTAGCANAEGKRAEFDADIVTSVKKAGGIILLVSNTPELCLNWETSNNLFGTTCNPYDLRRTSGGSSGGEASLLACGASLIGLGSDIAGSLRLPAHFCGVFSHKPSAGLVSIEGHYPTSSDVQKWTECFTLGPMARYASDLPKILSIIVKPDVLSSLNLQETVDINSIKFYYVEDNGAFLSSKIDSELTSSMNKVVKYLETFHNITPLKLELDDLKDSIILSYLPLLGINGVDHLFYKNEKKNIYTELLKFIFCSSKCTFTAIMYYILNNWTQKFMTTTSYAKIISKSNSLKKKMEDILSDDGVLLYPTFPTSARYHGILTSKTFDCSYLTLFNTFGFPVSTCPIGYDSMGLPIGIQVVSKINCDRLTLAVAQEFEKAFGGWEAIHFKKDS